MDTAGLVSDRAEIRHGMVTDFVKKLNSQPFSLGDKNINKFRNILFDSIYNEEIRMRLSEEYQELIKKERTESEELIQNERKLFQEKIDNLNKNHSEHLEVLRDQLTALYNQQIKDIKKNYEDLDLERQKNSKEAMEEKIAP